MNKKILLFSLLFFPLITIAYVVEPRKEKLVMRTSVIVPCVARHFFWLSGMLESYESQTIIPDEVIISLSEVESIDLKQIADLEAGKWHFSLKIIKNQGVIMDGENRSIAMRQATGDILIFSDADDIPHPQRVEFAKYIFENYEVDHLLHSYSFVREGLQNIDFEKVESYHFDRLDQLMHFAELHNIPVTTGSPCFLKKISEVLSWEGTKDVEYNTAVYRLFKNTAFVSLPLILYRVHLSSHRAQL